MPMIKMRKGDGPMGEPNPDGAPDYPSGLRLFLGEEEIKKLMVGGVLPKMPDLGEMLELRAMVKVAEVGEDVEKGDQKQRRIVLQIEDMGFYNEKSDSEKFYGS